MKIGNTGETYLFTISARKRTLARVLHSDHSSVGATVHLDRRLCPLSLEDARFRLLAQPGWDALQAVAIHRRDQITTDSATGRERYQLTASSHVLWHSRSPC